MAKPHAVLTNMAVTMLEMMNEVSLLTWTLIQGQCCGSVQG